MRMHSGRRKILNGRDLGLGIKDILGPEKEKGAGHHLDDQPPFFVFRRCFLNNFTWFG